MSEFLNNISQHTVDRAAELVTTRSFLTKVENLVKHDV